MGDVHLGGFFAFHSVEEFEKLKRNKLAKSCLKVMDFCEIWLENEKGNVELTKQEDYVVNLIRDVVGDDKYIGIHGPLFIINAANPSPTMWKAAFEEAKATIDIASKLNAVYVLFHAGNYPFFVKRKRVDEMMVSRFKQLVEYGRKRKVCIAVENVPYAPSLSVPYGSSLKEIGLLLRKCKDLYFVLDFPHLLLGRDSEAIIKKIHLERLIALHVHGFNGMADHVEINDDNLIDYGEIFEHLIPKLKRDLYVNVEVVGLREMKRSILVVKEIVDSVKKSK